MTFENPTTIGGTFPSPRPINLRVRPAKRAPELGDAEHLILATVTGAAALAWIVAFIRWFA